MANNQKPMKTISPPKPPAVRDLSFLTSRRERTIYTLEKESADTPVWHPDNAMFLCRPINHGDEKRYYADTGFSIHEQVQKILDYLGSLSRYLSGKGQPLEEDQFGNIKTMFGTIVGNPDHLIAEVFAFILAAGGKVVRVYDKKTGDTILEPTPGVHVTEAGTLASSVEVEVQDYTSVGEVFEYLQSRMVLGRDIRDLSEEEAMFKLNFFEEALITAKLLDPNLLTFDQSDIEIEEPEEEATPAPKASSKPNSPSSGTTGRKSKSTASRKTES